MCRACARCHSPRIYCQFRTACVIDLLTKEGELPQIEDKGSRADPLVHVSEETQV